MKNITIQNEATINARGKYNSKHCTPIMFLKVDGSELHSFTSIEDAANELNITRTYISKCLNEGLTCKGYIIFRTKDAAAYIGKIMHYFNVNASDARSYQIIKAEQEAARKAEERRLEEERKAREKHEANVAKVRAKIEKHTDNCNKLENKLLEEERALMEAEAELANLLGENQQVA